jgi:hypothetical protein
MDFVDMAIQVGGEGGEEVGRSFVLKISQMNFKVYLDK